MFDRGPGTHIQTDFRKDGLRRQDINPIDLGQVNPTGLIECGAQIEVRKVGPLPFLFGRGQGVLVEVNLGLESNKLGLDLNITLIDLLRVIVV